MKKTEHVISPVFNAVDGMSKRGGYAPSEKFDEIFRPMAEKQYGDKFENLFGVRNREYDTSVNAKYIDYYKSIYNIGDVFSDYFFNKMYDKVLLDKV